MKFLKIALRTFSIALFVTISSYLHTVQSSAITFCGSGSEKCNHQTHKSIADSSQDQGIAISSELDIVESKEISELDDYPEGPELKIFLDNDPLIATLSSRYRAALINFQRNLWQYSDVAVILILVLVTAIFVLTAGAVMFLLGPVFTAIVSLLLPFIGFGVVTFALLLQPTTPMPAAAVLG